MKGNARKNIRQKGKFINFLRPLMATGLPLIKNVHTSLAKSVQMQQSRKKFLDQA